MALDSSRIRALCFDVDGTLSDTDDVFASQIQRVLNPISFLFRDRDTAKAARRFVMWSEAPGNFLIGIPDILGVDDEIFSILEWINRKRPRPHKTFLLIDGVKEMLITLKPYYKMAVVSARDDQSTRIFLDRFELTPLFDAIVTAITAEHTKPFPDPILYAAQEMKVDPRECLMIGDTTVDIRAGKAAGAQTVGVLCGFGEEYELRKKGADEILTTTKALTQLLGKV